MAFGNGRGGFAGGGGGAGGKVCQFFLRGDCKFGDRCRNIHPIGKDGSDRQDRNPFAVLSNNQGGSHGAAHGRSQPSRGGHSGGFAAGQGSSRRDMEAREEEIKIDLTTERPIWPFSCYGPGRDAPAELITGEREESAEEMRVKHYIDAAAAQEHANQLLVQIESQRQAILNDIRGALRHIDDAGHSKDPSINRTLAVQRPSVNWKNPEPNQISNYQWNAQPNTTPFAQPQGPAQPPAFGQPSTPISSFGVSSQPAFGQPSKPAFGAPSNIGGSAPVQSAFGQPSGLGAPNRPNPFASSQQQATPAATAAPISSFGQKSSFGQQSQPQQQTAFGSQSTANPFGSSNQTGQGSSAFGTAQNQSPFPSTSAFGQPSQPQHNQNSFGAAGTSGGGGAFGGGFGQAQQQQSSGFGSGAQVQTQQPPATNFGAFGFQQSNQPATNGTAFGAPRQSANANSPAPFNQPELSSYARKAGNDLTAWNSNRVTYIEAVSNTDYPPSDDPKVRKAQKIKRVPVYQRHDDGTEERIWFPNGPDGVLSGNPATKSKLQEDAEAPAEAYKGELGETLKESYAFAWEHGQFKDGIMPEIPPQLDWVRYDV